MLWIGADGRNLHAHQQALGTQQSPKPTENRTVETVKLELQTPCRKMLLGRALGGYKKYATHGTLFSGQKVGTSVIDTLCCLHPACVCISSQAGMHRDLNDHDWCAVVSLTSLPHHYSATTFFCFDGTATISSTCATYVAQVHAWTVHAWTVLGRTVCTPLGLYGFCGLDLGT